MKLIKTKLLLKHNHNSAVGVATASHIDFCKYQDKCFKYEPDGWWSFKGYIQIFSMFIDSFLALLFMPFLVLSNGLILYPFWIVQHIIRTKKIIKEFGVDHINKSAEKLVKEKENDF